MKVVEFHGRLGAWGLSADPEDYDALPPLTPVVFDRVPHQQSPDRVALASYLFYGHFSSGSFETPRWHSPALSQAMAVDAAPVWIQTRPVELYAKPLPIGRRRVFVEVEGISSSMGVRSAHSTDYRLSFFRSDRSSGARRSFDSLEVSTNAWVLSLGRRPDVALRIELGCGVLFAEEVEADSLVVNECGLDEQSVRSLQSLLGAVRLGLEFA